MIHHLLPHVKEPRRNLFGRDHGQHIHDRCHPKNNRNQLGTLFGIAAVAFLNQINSRKALTLSTKTAETTEKIHTLSNSAMQAQLRIVMLQAKRIADMTKDPTDAQIAFEAERAYADHQDKQKKIDAEEIK